MESSWFDKQFGPVGEHDNGSSAPVGITIGYDTNVSSSSIGSAVSTCQINSQLVNGWFVRV